MIKKEVNKATVTRPLKKKATPKKSVNPTTPLRAPESYRVFPTEGRKASRRYPIKIQPSKVKIISSVVLLGASLAFFRKGYKVLSFMALGGAVGTAFSTLPLEYSYIPAVLSISFAVTSQIVEALAFFSVKK